MQDKGTTPVRGRFVHLRPLSEIDRDLIYELAIDPEVSHRWLFRGETPTRDEAFARTLHGSLASFAIVSNKTDDVAGIVITHDHDFRNQRVGIAMAHRRHLRGAGWPLEGTAVMIDWLFRNWPFRKITALATGFSADGTIRGAGRFFTEEARIDDVVFWHGRRWALHMFAIYRDDWQKLSERWKSQIPRGSAE